MSIAKAASGGSTAARGARLALLLSCLFLAFSGAAQAAPKVFYFGFGLAGSQGGQLSQPRDSAVNVTGVGPADPGDVYLVDELNHRIQRFDKNGNFISAWGADVIQAGKPGDVAGTNPFEICVVAVNCKAGIASAGNGVASGNGTLANPQSVAIDGDTGLIYVSDRNNRRISVYDGAGAFQRSFGFDVALSGPGNTGTAYEICVAANVDVCKAGVAGTGVGQYGAGTTASAFGIAVSPRDGNPASGTAFLANTQNQRVETYALDGTVPANFGSATQFGATQPRMIDIDSKGIVYASDANGSGEIDRYDSQGIHSAGVPGFIASIAVSPGGPLLAGNPASTTSGIAVDPDSDGAGPDSDVLQILRAPTAGSTVVQQFGPVNAPGLSAAPIATDEQHGADAGLGVVSGLGLDDASGRLYITANTGEHRVYVLADKPTHAPEAITGDTSPGLSDYFLTLEGVVNPAGFKLSQCRFEYGTTIEYGVSAPCVPTAAALGDGSSDLAVASFTEPLEPSTTYHYRLFAANAGAGKTGEDRTFTTGPSAADNCPNATRRAEQGVSAILLPDCMALELVSPPKKFNQKAFGPHVSPNGVRVQFQSVSALADSSGLMSPFGDTYVATRTGSGWVTAPTSPPAGMVNGWTEARNFSPTPDFSSWFQGISTPAQAELGFSQLYRGRLGQPHTPLSPLLVPQGGSTYDGSAQTVQGGLIQGVSTDHSHVYFRPGNKGQGFTEDKTVTYLPGDPQPAPVEEADFNIYVAKLDPTGEPSLELVARDSEGKAWGGNCGTRIGGIGGPLEAGIGERNQGAVSADGKRVYFSTRPTQPPTGSCNTVNKLRILKRVETSEGPWISPLVKEPSGDCDRLAPPCSTANGDDRYQGASVDGTKVYFTTNRQLADSDLDTGTACSATIAQSAGCDLYLYDAALPAGQRLIQVSAGEASAEHPVVGSGANVLNGTTAISSDGSHVYFVAKGVLTVTANPGGKTAVSGQPNLYLYQRDADHPNGRIAFIGTLGSGDSSGASGGLWGSQGTFRNNAYPVPVMGQSAEGKEVGGNGHVLLFISQAALTADDADGARFDLFRYDAEAGTLERISKAAPGGADGGAFDVGSTVSTYAFGGSIGTDFAERARWVSEDGETVTFRTPEGLLPEDVNGVMDLYAWREGQPFRLPGTTDATRELAGTATLSHDGSTIAFPSLHPLLAFDGDSINDVYVARVDGGFPHVVPPICSPDGNDSCREPAGAPPGEGSAASAAFSGPGNVKAKQPRPRPCAAGKRKVKRRGQTRCVPRKALSNQHANTDRRAGK